MSRHAAIAAALAFGLTLTAHAAATLQPVDVVLAAAGKTPDGAANASSAASTLMKDITSFRARSAQLAPAAAAQEWLALWDRSLDSNAKPQPTDYDAYDKATGAPVGPQSLLASLPAPEAWPLIRAEGKRRAAKAAPQDASSLGLKFLTDVLNRDPSAARQALASFERLAAAAAPGEREHKLFAVNSAEVLLARLHGSREDIAAGFLSTVDVHAKQRYPIPVTVPDLVGLVGEAKAEQLLTEAMKRPAPLTVPEGVATRALARKVALRDVGSLRIAQWGLVDGVGTSALYEAMQARFDPRAAGGAPAVAEGPDAGFDYQRMQADVYHFLDLVIAGRHAEAEAAMARASQRGKALNVPRKAMEDLAQRGGNAAVHAYLADLLARRPELPAWDFYLEQAAVTGQSRAALALIDKSLKRTDLTAHLRTELGEKRLNALLAADDVDAAAAGFRALLASPPKADDPKLGDRTTAALRLAGVGRVLKRPEWARLGVRWASDALALPPSTQGYWRPRAVTALLVELRRQGLDDAAQAVALAELKREGPAGYKGLEPVFPDAGKRAALVELTGLYDAAGRHADVRRLLDDVSTWAAPDLAEFVAEKDSMGTPIGLMAARALKAAGDLPGATRATRAVIAQLPNHDPAYALFAELVGDQAVAELDGMAARDPFEERPLVWKAVALAHAWQYAAAEDSARRAIAIDPSDGEQGANDRMRAYAVLADVLAAKGDAEAAQGYRRAVAAIRQSEQADEFHRLGLFQRAFAGYRAALAEFSDAYCIQSRLAVQLGKSGQQAEALKHYRRAFELMPDSFGRVESHCFGCESVFAGPSAQAVAEEVFLALLKGNAGKPQASYMLGYLRKEQGRYDEAVPLFRNAIAQDAMYLNAWRQLNDLGEKTYIDASERDIARLRLFELDPRQRHVRYQLDEVADLAALWRAVDRHAANRAALAQPEAVVPLPGSVRARQAALDALPPDMRSQVEGYVRAQRAMAESARVGPAAPVLARHKLLVAALTLMGVRTADDNDE